MRIAIITNAGISSRFNEGIAEDMKVLKCLYTEGGSEDTLLYHLMKKCAYADRIILVGGYQYEALNAFYQKQLRNEFPDVTFVENRHYADLGSGYSLSLGIQAAMSFAPDEVLFVEGDLDMDDASFRKVVDAEKAVLTYTSEPIYSNKAVVLYQDQQRRYRYAFNGEHGLLRIDEPFSCILNSGQVWKFKDPCVLEQANAEFLQNEKDGSNLRIIQRYFDAVAVEDVTLIHLLRWTNCNTRADYQKIRNGWEAEIG